MPSFRMYPSLFKHQNECHYVSRYKTRAQLTNDFHISINLIIFIIQLIKRTRNRNNYSRLVTGFSSSPPTR